MSIAIQGLPSSSRDVAALAGRLRLPHAVASKVRGGDRSVAIESQDTTEIAGRPVLIVDDIVSSGGTMIACAKALAAVGATTIDAIVTHALFPDDMCRKMLESGIRPIRSTHSVPHFTNAIALDGLLADALTSEMAEVRQ